MAGKCSFHIYISQSCAQLKPVTGGDGENGFWVCAHEAGSQWENNSKRSLDILQSLIFLGISSSVPQILIDCLPHAKYNF